MPPLCGRHLGATAAAASAVREWTALIHRVCAAGTSTRPSDSSARSGCACEENVGCREPTKEGELLVDGCRGALKIACCEQVEQGSTKHSQ